MPQEEVIQMLIQKHYLDSNSTFVAIIDGKITQTFTGFIVEISKAFQFPSYFSGNMNSFMEIMNDLEWLTTNNYLVIIINSDYFLKEDTLETQAYVKELFVKLSNEWENVPNYPGEDAYRKKAKFIVEYV